MKRWCSFLSNLNNPQFDLYPHLFSPFSNKYAPNGFLNWASCCAELLLFIHFGIHLDSSSWEKICDLLQKINHRSRELFLYQCIVTQLMILAQSSTQDQVRAETVHSILCISVQLRTAYFYLSYISQHQLHCQRDCVLHEQILQVRSNSVLPHDRMHFSSFLCKKWVNYVRAEVKPMPAFQFDRK